MDQKQDCPKPEKALSESERLALLEAKVKLLEAQPAVIQTITYPVPYPYPVYPYWNQPYWGYGYPYPYVSSGYAQNVSLGGSGASCLGSSLQSSSNQLGCVATFS